VDALVGGTTHQLALRRGRTTPDIVALSMLENRDHSVTEQESRCAAASTLNLMQGVAYRYNKAVWAVPPHSTVAKPGSGRVVALVGRPRLEMAVADGNRAMSSRLRACSGLCCLDLQPGDRAHGRASFAVTRALLYPDHGRGRRRHYGHLRASYSAATSPCGPWSRS